MRACERESERASERPDARALTAAETFASARASGSRGRRLLPPLTFPGRQRLLYTPEPEPQPEPEPEPEPAAGGQGGGCCGSGLVAAQPGEDAREGLGFLPRPGAWGEGPPEV